MHILISGATGLLGKVLVKKLLKNNHTLSVVTQNFSKARLLFPKEVTVYVYHPDLFKKSFDAIINLAGESLSQPWLPGVKKKILESRIKTTEFLLSVPANHLISTSAIGIYPSSSSLQNEETPLQPTNFLAQVCDQWEQEAQKFSKDVSIVRVGLILSSKGGFIQKMKPLFQWYLGAYLGSGNQGMSWIHVKDLASIYMFILEKKLIGIFNGVSDSTSHQNFFKLFAQLLHRKIFFKIPEVFLKFFLQDFSSLFLDSHFIESKLKKENFKFQYTNLEKTLLDCLKK